jgi:hypothetical protein
MAGGGVRQRGRALTDGVSCGKFSHTDDALSSQASRLGGLPGNASSPRSPAMNHVLRLARTATALGAAALTLAACGGGEEFACTLEARASVVVIAQDQAGAPLDNVQVDYRIDGGTPQRAVCLGAGPCTLEWEVRGQFSITATRMGYEPATAVVLVDGDACHVNTRMVTLTLNRIG